MPSLFSPPADSQHARSPLQRLRRLGWGLLLFCWGCTAGKPQEPKRTEQVPVTVAAAARKDVPVEIRTIGTVQPYATVSIRSRVGGQIMSVGFKEGQDVRKSDLLFTIDRRPLEAALAQVKANLAREVANLKNAEGDLVRYKELVATKTVSEEQFEQVRTKAEAMKATVAADQAAVEAAAVMLEYTTIRSPIDGRTGDLLVDEGNIVKADDTAPLVVINQLVPIYVSFSVPEQYLPDTRRHMAQRELKVDAIVPDDPSPVRGTVAFIDNTVDRATGTIQLKAVFANQDQRLWPGQFVDVVLQLTELAGATVVPVEALQTGQQGQYVFVVTAEQTAEMRPVTTGIESRGETVIAKGLAPGEQVVIDGQLRLSPGAKVRVVEKKAAKGPREKSP